VIVMGPRGPCPPPWWPENERWPPRDPFQRGYVVRLRFFRRFVLTALALLILAAAGVVALVGLLLAFNWWRGRQAEAASAALGKAIEIADAPVAEGTPLPGDTGPSFKSEQERAQRAVAAEVRTAHGVRQRRPHLLRGALVEGRTSRAAPSGQP
jgi:hypothetical protein